MSKYRKANIVLPKEVYDAFASISSVDVRDQYIRNLRKAQWTLQSIGDAVEMTRERVRQISTATPDPDQNFIADKYPVPIPPLKPEKQQKQYTEPTSETLSRLIELQPYAQKVRSSSLKYRKEAEEYTSLLDYAHKVEGVSIYRLSKRLGISNGAVRFRLTRYGYLETRGKSKAYQKIIDSNRYVLKS